MREQLLDSYQLMPGESARYHHLARVYLGQRVRLLVSLLVHLLVNRSVVLQVSLHQQARVPVVPPAVRRVVRQVNLHQQAVQQVARQVARLAHRRLCLRQPAHQQARQ